MLGNPKSKKKVGKKKQSCALIRSANAAVALPISFVSINMTHLNETQAVWSLNKIMGLSYLRNEKDLTQRLAIMGAEDEEKAKAHDLQHND
ncbi:hypothetical protein RHMOL_Rhmol08G0251400 [Rhododendron molle]|uniref:Uncharacterized protein n=1 Tax=Rhododendron molle TaxID=49168 RepID=A0ACC0MU64_RHOML|nr:hypothetical protein RHMOL_Rhmol08G0251400 [Rhododendron molle]